MGMRLRNGDGDGREVVTFRLQGGAFYGAFDRAFNRAFDEAFYGDFYKAFEEKGVFEEKEVLSKLNRGRRRRLHPLGEYVITLYTNGHTPKGVGLRVVDSHTGNHREDDFTPLETFRGFLSAFRV
ncbi:hypothetical protein Tco_1288671 [Tanacetum coccineum]